MTLSQDYPHILCTDISLVFSSDLRLKKPAEFKAVFDKPDHKQKQGPFLFLIRQNNLNKPRLGLVVGKKRLARSVDRNKIKRQVRESFRLMTDRSISIDVVLLYLGSQRNLDQVVNLRKLLDSFFINLRTLTGSVGEKTTQSN